MKQRRQKQRFSLKNYLSTSGSGRGALDFKAGQVIFSQGEEATDIYYIRQGTAKITTVSKSGTEAVVALLTSGDFFGEGCLLGQPKRLTSATAMTPTSLIVLKKKEAVRILREEPAFADRFIVHMLKRNLRIEADLVDQLFNSTEKRLARALLLLAHYGKDSRPEKVIPRISQQTLAQIIGTNRGRVNIFMNKFRKLGYIEYNGGLLINSSLVSVVLHD
jgi:CRP/FNR family cyclic AMP-dependent transcriptional regulator